MIALDFFLIAHCNRDDVKSPVFMRSNRSSIFLASVSITLDETLVLHPPSRESSIEARPHRSHIVLIFCFHRPVAFLFWHPHLTVPEPIVWPLLWFHAGPFPGPMC
jgi:hypothetical protein